MASSLPEEVAETVQTAHIVSRPDPLRDNTPSTAADEKQPVSVKQDGIHEDDYADIPYSILDPAPRTYQLPPLPDLRFEQSYLNSIASADTWWKVVLITTRDQVVMPLAQGLIYNLLLCGWQEWNRNARIHGNTVGARFRRWWYGVNNWEIPERRS